MHTFFFVRVRFGLRIRVDFIHFYMYPYGELELLNMCGGAFIIRICTHDTFVVGRMLVIFLSLSLHFIFNVISVAYKLYVQQIYEMP